MKITTSSGKTFDAYWTLQTIDRHGAQLLAIQLPGTTTPGEILEGLIGEKLIEEHKNDDEPIPHEGYTLLSSITYSRSREIVRVVLEKDGDV